MLELVLAAIAFTGSHMIMSHGAIRSGLIARLGLWPHRLVYSVIAIATLAWLVLAYRAAPDQALFHAPIALKHMPLSLMFFAAILLVGGYTIVNPSALGMENAKPARTVPCILKITRAPVMWGCGLFSFSHMLANPDMASWLFFGSLTVLALAGGWHLDRRKQGEGEARWIELAGQTSFIPFAALVSRRTKLRFREISWWRLGLAFVLYAGMLAAHSAVIGISPIPLPK